MIVCLVMFYCCISLCFLLDFLPIVGSCITVSCCVFLDLYNALSYDFTYFSSLFVVLLHFTTRKYVYYLSLFASFWLYDYFCWLKGRLFLVLGFIIHLTYCFECTILWFVFVNVCSTREVYTIYLHYVLTRQCLLRQQYY